MRLQPDIMRWLMDCFVASPPRMTARANHHPVPEPRIRHEALLIFPEYPVTVARDEIIERVAERLAPHATPAPPNPADGSARSAPRRI